MTPAPARWSRIPALGWLMARAFTANRVLAALAWPITAPGVVPYVARRTAYEAADRNGMVIVARRRPVLDALLTVPILLLLLVVIMGAWAALAIALGPVGILLGNLLPLALMIASVSMLTRSPPASVVGPETPDGDQWAVASLSQRPGTRLSALLLARQVLAQLPPGVIVVAAAANDETLDAYVRLGFTRGEGRRVYRIVR